MTATQFTSIFLAALLLTTLARLWLARRHLVHIAAHRAEVPEAFREKIRLGEHQKAAESALREARAASPNGDFENWLRGSLRLLARKFFK